MTQPHYEICYLCGLPFNGDVNDDHVPPRQFYPELLRKQLNPNLLTLKTHESCNKAFQRDEDYFLLSVGPMVAESSHSGRALWDDIARRIKRPESVGLAVTVSKEFQEKIGSLYLPDGKVAKRFDPDRIWGVIWKIARGLFFYETGRFLPVNTPNRFYLQLEAGREPPAEFEHVRNAPSKGRYGAIFDYKYVVEEKLNNFNLWAMLFWDAWIVMVGFHDPGCPCDHCQNIRKRANV